MAADRVPDRISRQGDVDRFLEQCRNIAARPRDGTAGRNRLIFALDATGSRQPTWDTAAQLQGDMFLAAAALGGLEVQLCFYRGHGEFKVSRYLRDAPSVLRLMTSVSCRAGQTQIGKVLVHVLNEARIRRPAAFVFVGDCMEEDVDHLGHLAGQLGVLQVPGFLFHEGDNPVAALAFGEIARLSGGACCRFDAGSAAQLRALLRAVAVYAAGGIAALASLATTAGPEVKLIANQIKGG